MINGSQQCMGLHGAVENSEQEMFPKMRHTASRVDNNYHMEVHLPLAFHQGNRVCTVILSVLKGPVSETLMNTCEKEQNSYCS